MNKVTFVALLVTFATVVLCQPRPDISRTFEAKVFTEWHEPNKPVHYGEGWMVLDQPNNRGLEILKFPTHHERDSYRLQRYDLGLDFSIVAGNKSNCVTTHVTGNMPDEWAWVSNASFVGRHQFRHHVVDIWSFTNGYATIDLGVFPDSNIPAFLFRNGTQSQLLIEFAEFRTHQPPAVWFNVPTECSTNATESDKVGCVSRSTMISHAQSWVNAHVPYNQQGSYGGYREDCSGYVSMAWESSKPGHTTSTMHEIAHPISRGELQPGDVLLCASEHVVLFGGWVDGSHYTAYEETRPGEGTVKRTTPYPYWYNTGCFLPYRYNSVC